MEIHIFLWVTGACISLGGWKKQYSKDANKGLEVRKARVGLESSSMGTSKPRGQVQDEGHPRDLWSPRSRYQFINASLVGSGSKFSSRSMPIGLMGGCRKRLLNSVMNRFLMLNGSTLESLRSLLEGTRVGWGLQITTEVNELPPELKVYARMSPLWLGMMRKQVLNGL